MSEIRRNRPRISKERDLKKLLRFIEELSWLMSAYSTSDLKYSLESLLDDRLLLSLPSRPIEAYTPSNPNTHFLVGVLPKILTDETIFPSNEDIADFSEKTLNISIPRWEKKSKYELIGHIVCSTNQLDDERLSILVEALIRLISDGSKAMNLIKSAKSEKTDWNVIIQKLITEN